MYILQFVRMDGKPNEEYYYHKESDAMYHLALFEGDDSGLYKSISVVDGFGNCKKSIYMIEIIDNS